MRDNQPIELQGFYGIMRETKKIKDLYKTIEGKLAVVGGIIVAACLHFFLIDKPVDFINSLLIDIALMLIPALIGLLGITFAGLAFASGTISLKATENLYKEGKIESLTSIFFSFYFSGWMISNAIIINIIMFFAALSNFEINFIVFWLGGFIVAYFTLFVVFYTVGLFDTCIKLFFANYKYNQKSDNEE